MEEKILKTIEQYNMIESGDKLVLGVSGGPDSICMLDILNKIKDKMNFTIIAAHINHGIREEAVKDEKYVKEFCEKINVPFFALKTNVLEIAKEQRISTEEAGRNVRYEFFGKILKETNSNKIATAHNANDNAETVLMNLIRGCGTVRIKGNR